MTDHSLPELTAAFAEILERAGARFCLIGGLAVVSHGHIRATKDLDFLVDALNGWQSIAADASALGLEAPGGSSDDALLFLRPVAAGFGVDLLGVESELERAVIQRAVPVRFGVRDVPVIRLEDLIALKLSVGRPQDDADADALIELSRARLDLEALRRVARSFGVADKLEHFLAPITEP